MAHEIWAALPIELKLSIVSLLSPESILSFSQVSRGCRAITEDSRVCDAVLARYFPLAAARLSKERAVQGPDASLSSAERFKAAKILRQRFLQRQCLDSYELITADDPQFVHPGSMDEPLVLCSQYNYGHLIYYFQANTVVFLVSLQSRHTTKLQLPENMTIQDAFLADGKVFVLSKLSKKQDIFVFDFDGQLVQTLSTGAKTASMLLANRTVAITVSLPKTSAPPTYIIFDLETHGQAGAKKPKKVKHLDAYEHIAIDDRYLYQADLRWTVINAYDLEQRKWHPCEGFDDDNAVGYLAAVNGHCYQVREHDMSFRYGTEITTCPLSYPERMYFEPGDDFEESGIEWDDSPSLNRRQRGVAMVPEIGGYVTFENADMDEEGPEPGFFAYVPIDPPEASAQLEYDDQKMIDCGRIKCVMPSRLDWPLEKPFRVHSDHQWTVYVFGNSLIILQWA